MAEQTPLTEALLPPEPESPSWLSRGWLDHLPQAVHSSYANHKKVWQTVGAILFLLLTQADQQFACTMLDLGLDFVPDFIHGVRDILGLANGCEKSLVVAGG